MRRCKEIAGILFKRPCKEPAAYTCTSCGKPICEAHARPGGGAQSCVSCTREAMRDPSRRGTYAHLREDPYFFWYFHEDAWFGEPYGDEDYSLFETGASDFGDMVEDNWEGS
ncbi:MAG: hypothetical protein H6713_26770 [Myxococcales bacterium]|nr:hypothetical protein [Myxococcales bacterium]